MSVSLLHASLPFQSTLSMRRATRSSNLTQLDVEFQSTLSMRRATAGLVAFGRDRDISIHALHEESDHTSTGWPHLANISIHALHEESDPCNVP